jgi:hypothetical protein
MSTVFAIAPILFLITSDQLSKRFPFRLPIKLIFSSLAVTMEDKDW